MRRGRLSITAQRDSERAALESLPESAAQLAAQLAAVGLGLVQRMQREPQLGDVGAVGVDELVQTLSGRVEFGSPVGDVGGHLRVHVRIGGAIVRRFDVRALVAIEVGVDDRVIDGFGGGENRACGVGDVLYGAVAVVVDVRHGVVPRFRSSARWMWFGRVGMAEGGLVRQRWSRRCHFRGLRCDGGDGRGEEADLRVEDFDRGQRGVLVEDVEEAEPLRVRLDRLRISSSMSMKPGACCLPRATVSPVM
jgi:hypothetical protein